MATLRDVAREAGVSSATASRALTHSGPVSTDTRERVVEAARKLDYQVNNLARGLRTQRTRTLGLLVPDVRNPFFTDLAYHVDKAAAQRGLAVMMGSADEQAGQQDRYLNVLTGHHVDGIIAVPQGAASETLVRTAASVPTVLVDRDPGIPGVPTVTSDNHGGMTALVDHVVSLGRRRIGVVAGPQTTSTGRERLDALRGRLAEHGIELPTNRIAEGDFQLESGLTATAQLLAGGDLDAIVAADNLMGLGAIMVLRQEGIGIGDDMALACVDDIPWFSLVDPAITVIAQDVSRLGEVAVELLQAQADGHTVESVVVPMHLIPRTSCGEKNTTHPAPTGEIR
ncbi:LacI family DNA-binding transcriptional regulator [Austwickia chelonae]|uniref:Putative LacI family transcriptional regulator n=1 Tax=Austwickia chelonae NBRC 105200 TaxID=1184607 RepID=K6UN14_9MICO|nr:substrate-binding domain-containing protein [Austwickia chelonae]GAB78601.1 putative LacI family transcriptional regulator [Austwickia chelonae NBRC 105200]